MLDLFNHVRVVVATYVIRKFVLRSSF